MKRTQTILLLIMLSVSAAAQKGGGLNLEQNVIGDGGWRSDGGGFTILGTTGQSNAGSVIAGGKFNLVDGLWATENQNPNSPFASVSGRVTRTGSQDDNKEDRDGDGVGIVLATVTLTNRTTNVSYTTHTGPFGSYRFTSIPVDANYVITVRYKHFEFRPTSIAIFLSQDRGDLDFVGQKAERDF